MDSYFICAFCLEKNTIFVDPAGGESQRYVEDCQVCCRPNILSIYWDEWEDAYVADSEPEG